jgi:hypothetical protein
MVVTLDNDPDATKMLEVQQANTNPHSESQGEASTNEILSYSNGPQNSPFSSSPILIAVLPQDEYATRSSRESVLQRLSEALLRRSLTKVRRRTLLPGSKHGLVKMPITVLTFSLRCRLIFHSEACNLQMHD